MLRQVPLSQGGISALGSTNTAAWRISLLLTPPGSNQERKLVNLQYEKTLSQERMRARKALQQCNLIREIVIWVMHF